MTGESHSDVSGGGTTGYTMNGGPAAESTVEARIARLESDVGHILSDVADIKADVRSLRELVDAVKDSIASAKVWALLLYFGLTAIILSAMALGFGWL